MESTSSSSTRRSDRKRKNRVHKNDLDNVTDSKKRKIDSQLFRQSGQLCQQLLNEMRNHKYAMPFNRPVNPVLDGVPDYNLVIKKPMDFQTIQNKLKADVYSNSAEFATDMRLVFQNCLTYNHPSSEIVRQAKVLSAFFEKKYVPILKYEQEFMEEQQAQEMKSIINELRTEHQKLLNELSKLHQDNQAQSGQQAQVVNPDGTVTTSPFPPRKKAGRPKKNPSSLTGSPQIQQLTTTPAPHAFVAPPEPEIPHYGYEEKKELNDKILLLTQEDLERMVQVMGSDLSLHDDELEIDLEKLSNSAIHKLNNFVLECLRNRPPATDSEPSVAESK